MKGVRQSEKETLLNLTSAGFWNGESINGINPVSPHALRESFGKIAIGQNIPDTVVDFWLGHQIGDMAKAYKQGKFNELRNLYIQLEPYLSISQSSIRDEVEELKAENERLKKRMDYTDMKVAQEVGGYLSRVLSWMNGWVEENLSEEKNKEYKELLKEVILKWGKK